MPFVIKIYVQWKDRDGEYKKPQLHMAWPLLGDNRIGIVQVMQLGNEDSLRFEADYGFLKKYTGWPDNSENCGIYPCANCRQIIAFYDDRNKVMTQLVIDERPGGMYLREKVLPWIRLQLDYYKRIACLGNL